MVCVRYVIVNTLYEGDNEVVVLVLVVVVVVVVLVLVVISNAPRLMH
jgi:hypothetical protein